MVLFVGLLAVKLPSIQRYATQLVASSRPLTSATSRFRVRAQDLPIAKVFMLFQKWERRLPRATCLLDALPEGGSPLLEGLDVCYMCCLGSGALGRHKVKAYHSLEVMLRYLLHVISTLHWIEIFELIVVSIFLYYSYFRS